MLSLASLLNPAPPGALPPPTPRYRPSPSALSSPAPSFSSDCHSLYFDTRQIMSAKHSKMVKDSGGFVKSKAKGTVNFAPFESLDEHSLHEIKRYQIYPLGKIQEYCRHIPYNSGKKDFYEKTGRESFEVFQYIFKVPGDDNEYTVMWDYNVGLVRMTPFFKCCKYSKTQPAKMLNLNPGLRDITHSITGGSIMAQGYWMPFACAKAVCATFCAPIAGALIPIFGPDFPSQCTSPDAPEHGRMQIDPMIVAESVREADMFRRMYANAASAAANSHLPPLQQQQQSHHQHQQIHSSQMHHYSHGPALLSPTSISSPRLNHRRALPRYSGSPHDYDCERLSFENRMRFKRGPENSSPYMTDSEPDMQHGGGGGGGQEMHHHALAAARGGMMYSPVSPPRSSGNNGGWSVVANNNNHHQHQNTHPRHAQQQQQHVQHVSSPATAYRPSAYREPHDLSSFPSASDPLLSSIPRFGRGGNIPRLLDPQHHQLSSQPPNQQHPYIQPQTQAFPPRLPPIPTAIPSATWSHVHSGSNNSSKRPVAEILEVTDGGGDYEAYSDKSSPATTVTTNTSLSAEQQPGASGTDKSAALLLMTLSVKDVRDGGPGEAGGLYAGQVRGCGQESMSMSPVSAGLGGGQDGHRSKRQRATSM